MPKEYTIQYNTKATGLNDKWSVAYNGKAIFVSNVVINAPCSTSLDSVVQLFENINIICYGICEIKNNIAYIKSPKTQVNLARHIAKTISWRIIGSIDTLLLSWLITGNFKIGAIIGSVEVFTKMILYFFHERVWYKLKFGKKQYGSTK